MKLWKLGAAAAGAYLGYKWWTNRHLGDRGLRLAFAQAGSEVGAALARLGLWGAAAVGPSVTEAKPMVTVTLPPGVNPEDVASEIPAVAAGIPVQIVATPAA